MIDALLGCSIELPKVFELENVNLYDDFDTEKSRGIMDCYFNCCNLLREFISAFSYQFYKQNLDEGEDDVKQMVSNGFLI